MSPHPFPTAPAVSPKKGLFPGVVEIRAQVPTHPGQMRDWLAAPPNPPPIHTVDSFFSISREPGWEPSTLGQALDQPLLSLVSSGTKAPSCPCSAQTQICPSS